jgi:hypothetical protein
MGPYGSLQPEGKGTTKGEDPAARDWRKGATKGKDRLSKTGANGDPRLAKVQARGGTHDRRRTERNHNDRRETHGMRDPLECRGNLLNQCKERGAGPDNNERRHVKGAGRPHVDLQQEPVLPTL